MRARAEGIDGPYLCVGAWRLVWRRIADRLRRDGHAVFTPTLTGLGERSHLLRPGIDLATHVADIVNMMRWERLSEVILCGHSYGGFVISGVAEEMPALMRSIVFLDAFVPENGDTLQKLITRPAFQDAIRAALQRRDLAVPPPPAEAFGVNEADRAWVDSLCVPQPIGTFTSPIALSGARENIGR